MSKFLSYLLPVLIFLLLVFSGYQYHKNQVLESRMNTLSLHLQKVVVRDSVTLSEISKQQFKEDYYIQQLDKDTSLILFVVSGLFLIAGFFSFKMFDERVIRFSEEIREEAKNQEVKYSSIEHKLKGLKVKISFDNSYFNKNKADASLYKADFLWYTVHSLTSLDNIKDYYIWLKEQKNSLSETVLDDIVKYLSEVDLNLKGGVKMDKGSYLLAQEHIKSIRKVDDGDVDKLLSKIHSKLNVITNS